MGRGDHIYVNCGVYTHHGIDCGDGTVIHYSQKGHEGVICRITMAKFAVWRQVFVKQYCKSLQPDTVIRRAESRLNERKYNLAFNNCEHFVAWCKTGVAVSEQVDRASASFAGYGHVVVSAIGDIANATDTAARTAAALGDAFLRNPLAIARGAIDEVPNYPNVVVELFGK